MPKIALTFAASLAVLAAVGLTALRSAERVSVVIDTPMPPPDWALMERELLRANSEACIRFAEKYVDERGYLLHTPRWGTLDGPDDAIETFFNWTLLHALGGSDEVLEIYKKAQEGHWRQYNELRTENETIARYVDQASDQLRRFADQIRQKGVGDMLDDINGFARRRPALFIGGAFLVGLGIARFLKSSAERDLYESDTTSGFSDVDPMTTQTSTTFGNTNFGEAGGY